MIAKQTLRVFTLLVAVAAAIVSADAMAACTSCGVPVATSSVVGTAPVTYQAAFAPATTTAFVPVASTSYSSGWYPGYWLGRANRSIWGVPSTTTFYAPVTTANFAPVTTANFAPVTTANFAPVTTTSFAPTCSTCTAHFAPACSTCSTCSASTVSFAAPACDACTAGGVTQAAHIESMPSAASASTFIPQTSGTASSTMEPQPTLDPNQQVPGERTMQQTDKPLSAEPPLPAESPSPDEPPLQPQPQADTTDDSTTNIQAPQLFDPNDHTARRHPAPVWTAVYHQTAKAETATQTVSFPQAISLEQAELDAEGWASAAE